MRNLDFLTAKKNLLQEYIQAGGRDAETFLHGMTCLQDYIESVSPEERLNEAVPQELRISYLQKELMAAIKEIERLKGEVSKKQSIVRDYRKMSVKERKSLRMDAAYRKLEKDNDYLYAKMVAGGGYVK